MTLRFQQKRETRRCKFVIFQFYYSQIDISRKLFKKFSLETKKFALHITVFYIASQFPKQSHLAHYFPPPISGLS